MHADLGNHNLTQFNNKNCYCYSHTKYFLEHYVTLVTILALEINYHHFKPEEILLLPK